MGTHRAEGWMLVALSSIHSLSARQAWQTSTVFFRVAVHVFVAGLHDLPAHGVSSSTVHCTHKPAAVPASAVVPASALGSALGSSRQTPLPVTCEQSEFTEHGRQVFSLGLSSVRSHFGALGVLQSAFERQATQAFVTRLHWGFAASLQSVLLRQPTQTFEETSQTDLLGSLQSALVTHSTQVFASNLQAFLPVTVAQSVLTKHCTQVLSVSQTAFGAAQCDLDVQATHRLSGSLHTGLGAAHAPLQ